MSNLSLHDILNAGYSNNPKMQQELVGKHGYMRDNELSNDKHQVYHKDGKLLYNINGTQNNSLGNILRDWNDNLQIGLGRGRSTERFEEEHGTLEKAKKKHKVDSAVITGHSKGGFYAGEISSPKDKVITFNKASVGGATRKNETAYRSITDPVSLLSAGAKHSKTILNNGLLNSHGLNSIKNKKIKIEYK
jgi:hypothetical protein